MPYPVPKPALSSLALVVVFFAHACSSSEGRDSETSGTDVQTGTSATTSASGGQPPSGTHGTTTSSGANSSNGTFTSSTGATTSSTSEPTSTGTTSSTSTADDSSATITSGPADSTADGMESSEGGSAVTSDTEAGESSADGSTSGPDNVSTTPTEPQERTIRVFYLLPNDVAFDQRYPDGIGNVMLEAQAFFKEKLGKTFRLNDPIVEVVEGEHEQEWYEETQNGGDRYWWSATNAQQEIWRRFDLPDDRWMGVSLVSAEGEGAGGGASGGWVLLPGHDADGGAGYPAQKARWVGGMVHELGHAFGLPDSASTDGTCMSATFYSWPECEFTESQVNTMLNSRWGADKFLF